MRPRCKASQKTLAADILGSRISTFTALKSNDIIHEKLTNTQEAMIGLSKDSQTQSIDVQESKSLLQNIIHTVQKYFNNV